MITRRTVLKGMLGVAAASLLPRPARASAARRLAPVDVSPDRVIRTVAGLRPYRPSGFVVRTETVGDKTVVHNYGHGGAGITLSWGTAELAVDQAWQTGERDFAVLGCGAVGLATARLLQQRGATVTIYARELPPQTTSNIAGGQWGPAFVADRDARTPAWNRQFEAAAHLAHRAFQNLVGADYGVRWLDHYQLSGSARGPFPEAIEAHRLTPEESPFPGEVTRFYTMLIEPPLYLHRLTQDFLAFGGRIVVRNLPDRAAIQELPPRVLLNCTGLGSRELFGDQELVPVKGQLTVLLPQPEVDYAVLAGDLYMFPRQDGILLGGTHERGNFSLEPDPAAEKRILEGHRQLFASLRTPG